MIHRLYFDLETLPDQRPGAMESFAASIQPPSNMSKPETIAKWEAEKRPYEIERAWLKTSLQGGRGKVAVAGWAFNDEPPMSAYSDDWASEEGERETIRAFFGSVDAWLKKNWSEGNSIRPQIIGHNVIGFDLRFLFQRCVVLRVPIPHWLPVNVKPWDQDLVFDTMVVWGGHKAYTKMDEICEALDIPKKGSEFDGDEDIDGSKVWSHVRDGKIDVVARYCEGDIQRTRDMHRRMVFDEVLA